MRHPTRCHSGKKKERKKKKDKETSEEKFVRKLVYQGAKLPLTTDSPTPTPTLAAHMSNLSGWISCVRDRHFLYKIYIINVKRHQDADSDN